MRFFSQYLVLGVSLSKLAAENGINLCCAYRWLHRYVAINIRLRKHTDLGWHSP